ncbi:hypothetical protein DSO57_1024285 [Entomophthora muscae]|uniref:Uncharacterized protein n=1 Tax=Entomophthora muscae TaxID=34485 RepID=A0ACC2TPH3_9FUNG|nr:hypothetical protein DSO57_1024285 [Entomophthora muscae]
MGFKPQYPMGRQSAGPAAWPTADFWAQTRRGLTLENLLRIDEQKLLTLRPPTPTFPVNPTNESAGQAKNPEITWATAAGEVKKLSVKCRPPKDDKFCDLKGKFELSQSEPANEITPTIDNAQGCKNLVDNSTWPKGICKSFSMADGYTYTLGRQEVTHCHSSNKFCASYLFTQRNCRPAIQTILSPIAPYGPVHFTEYPSNPAYSEFTLEEILIHDPEARTRETETVYREDTKAIIPLLLFRNKYNYLPAYLVPMTLSLTPQPKHMQESVTASKSTSTQHQLCGGPCLQDPWAICPQIPRNLPQAGFLTLAVLASILIGLHADSGTPPETQFLDSSWRQVIPGVWYTATPLSHNPPQKKEPWNYQFVPKPVKPQVFCPLASAFLLCYLGAYFFLGRFNLLLGRYCIVGKLFHLGMMSLPVGSLVTVLNLSAIIHHLKRLLSSEWVPDRLIKPIFEALFGTSSQIKTLELEYHLGLVNTLALVFITIILCLTVYLVAVLHKQPALTKPHKNSQVQTVVLNSTQLLSQRTKPPKKSLCSLSFHNLSLRLLPNNSTSMLKRFIM